MKIPKLVLQVMNLVLQLVLQVILQVKPAKKKKATKLRKLGTTACKFPKFFQEKQKLREDIFWRGRNTVVQVLIDYHIIMKYSPLC